MSVDRAQLKERLNETRLKVSQGSRCDVNEELVVEETRALLSELEQAERERDVTRAATQKAMAAWEPLIHKYSIGKVGENIFVSCAEWAKSSEAALRTLREASVAIAARFSPGQKACAESFSETIETPVSLSYGEIKNLAAALAAEGGK